MKLSKLIYIQLKNNFSFKRFFGFDLKKNKTKTILIGLAIVYALGALIASFGYMFFDLGGVLNEINQTHLLISFSTVYALVFSMITVLLRASGYLFYYKDYDILAPLPIHSRKLFIAKLVVLLTMIYFVNFIIALPIMFSYFYWEGFNILSLLIYIIGFVLIPLIPTIVMSLLSLGISLFTSKLRYSKIINLVIMVVVFIGIMALSSSISNTTVNPLTGQIDLFSNITKYYLPFKWFNDAVYQNSLLDLLWLIGSHVIIFGVAIYFIEKLAEFTNKRGIRSNVVYKQKKLSYQQKPVVQSLVEKEFKKFFGSTLYALNSGIGLIMLIVLAIASLIFKADVEGMLSQEFGFALNAEIMLMVVFGFVIGMTYTPAVSLSLEGKNLWILKSLPISAPYVMFSKVVFNLVLILPIAIASLVMLGISLSIPFISIVLLMVLIIAFSILTSCIDAVINLYLPKFEFQNEAEVVKQSAAAFLGIFGTFGILITFGFVYYLLSGLVSIEIGILLLIALSTILTIPFVWIIKNKSEKLFLGY